MPIVDITRIIAWQKGHEFVKMTYDKCRKLPDYERYGFYSQFTRAAISITANIAEGVQKVSKADKLRFLNISQGSLSECYNYIILGRDLHYFTNEDAKDLLDSLKLTSYFLDKYIEGISDNKGIKDNL